jgi:hypothetical protein
MVNFSNSIDRITKIIRLQKFTQIAPHAETTRLTFTPTDTRLIKYTILVFLARHEPATTANQFSTRLYINGIQSRGVGNTITVLREFFNVLETSVYLNNLDTVTVTTSDASIGGSHSFEIRVLVEDPPTVF